jgi:type II secretory pathway component GspD/PulD (secretin)
MAVSMKDLVSILKKEGFSGDECCQYYREVEFNGRWRLFDVLEDMLLAYSVIRGDLEILVVMNTSCTEEIENRVTVDRNLSPVGSKLKDIAGRPKNCIVEEHAGRNFVTVKLKPNSFAVLRTV